jgi:DNA replication protein DnaC
MQPLSDALARIRPRRLASNTDTPPLEPEIEPTCPICKDFGFVRKDVPLGDPEFGRAVPCECRASEAEERVRRRSNLGALSTRTFDTFDPTGRERLNSRARQQLVAAFDMCRDYAENPEGWLFLHGPPGVGKTHLAAAIANKQVELRRDVFFAVVPDLLDSLRATYKVDSDLSYNELFDSLRQVRLLVLDDLGMEYGSEWAHEKLFQLLNHRYSLNLATVITTNHRVEELDQRVRVRLNDKSMCLRVAVQDWRHSVVEELLGRWPKRLQRHTFDTFLVSGSDEYATRPTRKQSASLQTALNAAIEFAHEPNRWLVFVGEGSRGKTHLAAAIKNERASNKLPTLFMTVPDLLHYLRQTYHPNSHHTYDEVFDAISSADVLILDDYGRHYATPWAEEKLFQLLNHRFNEELPTVITTSVPFDKPGGVAGQEDHDRILERLLDADVAAVVRIDAPAFRRVSRSQAASES